MIRTRIPTHPSPDDGWASFVSRLESCDPEGLLSSSLSGEGPISELEDGFAKHLGVAHVLALSSGTAALAAGLLACGVGPGDECIVSSYDWGSAVAAVRSVGAEARFADIEERLWTIDPSSVAEAITPRTTAIVATHILGQPADVRRLYQVAQEAGAALIEDCSQSLGAFLEGRATGTFGDAAVFSLGWGKGLCAGEGGLLVTSSAECYERAVSATQHPQRQLLDGASPNAFALNYRMNPLGALHALSSLPTLASRCGSARRRGLALNAALCDSEGLEPVAERFGAEHSFYRFVPNLDRSRWGLPRQIVIEALGAEGLPVYRGAISTPLNRVLSGDSPSCLVADKRCDEQIGLVLPASEQLEELVPLYAVAIDKVYEGRSKLGSLGASLVPCAAPPPTFFLK